MLNRLKLRLRALFHKTAMERELDEELRFHLEKEMEQNLRRGMNPKEARYAALRSFGGVEQMKEESRDVRGIRFVEELGQDLRYGWRVLTKNKGFTAVAVLTLALGIGVNSSIFSVVHTVLLRPLPYKEPDRIVQFWETNPLKGWNDDKAPCSPGNFLDWKNQSQSFEAMGAYYMGSHKSGNPKNVTLSDFYLTGDNEPVRLQGLRVMGDLFSVLGIPAEMGRTFRTEETWEGQGHVVILSHGLWQRQFGADPSIVGRDIQLNGVSTSVVGVMPASFSFPTKEVDLWTPFGWNRERMADFRPAHMLRVIGRLKPGVTLEQAKSELTGIAGRLAQQYPVTNENMGVGLAVIHDWEVTDTQLALYVFLGAVAFVLAVACANVANLLLARAATRTKEFALRAGLGVGRKRLIRQLLTENLLLSLLGGIAGLTLAAVCNRLVVVFNPGDIPRLDEVRLDAPVLGFTIGVTFLTAVVFGLVPAISGSKTDLNETLKDAAKMASHSGKGAKMGNLLVIGAGLMIKSYMRLHQIDPGFDSSNLLTLKTDLPDARYNSPGKQWDFYQQVLNRICSLPGVQSAAAVSVLPAKGSTFTGDFTIEGRPSEEYGKEALRNYVTPDYFQTMKIPVVSGRAFSETDTGRSLVIVISEALARRHFANHDPIGQRIKFSKPEQNRPWYTIIGIVKDVKQEGLAMEARPEVYEPFSQMANSYMNLVIRTSDDPHNLIAAVRGESKAVDKDVPPYNLQTMDELLSSSVSKERFTTLLLAIFATVALLLAAVGIYGVVSYAVTQRTNEMGIRMALGAGRRDILALVIAQGLKLVIIGLAAGLVAAFALTRFMMTLLYGVSSTDPATFAFISGLLTAVALLACYIPARRATRIDPMVALRYE